MYRPSWISCYMKIGWFFNLGPHPNVQSSCVHFFSPYFATFSFYQRNIGLKYGSLVLRTTGLVSATKLRFNGSHKFCPTHKAQRHRSFGFVCLDERKCFMGFNHCKFPKMATFGQITFLVTHVSCLWFTGLKRLDIKIERHCRNATMTMIILCNFELSHTTVAKYANCEITPN